MLLKEAQPTLQKPRRREPASVEHDPASLSAKLRELAVRAHRLVRAIDETRSRPASRARCRSALQPGTRADRAATPRSSSSSGDFDAQNLGDLAAYVSALRQRVEEYLA